MAHARRTGRYNRFMKRFSLSFALLLTCLPPARAEPPPAPADKPASQRDAAEQVQEGNVRQWIEYYRRTHPNTPAPEAPPAPPPSRPAPPAPAPDH